VVGLDIYITFLFYTISDLTPYTLHFRGLTKQKQSEGCDVPSHARFEELFDFWINER